MISDECYNQKGGPPLTSISLRALTYFIVFSIDRYVPPILSQLLVYGTRTREPGPVLGNLDLNTGGPRVARLFSVNMEIVLIWD